MTSESNRPIDTVQPGLSTRRLLETLKEQLGTSLHTEVPELYSPFEPRIHPETAHVQERSLAWLRRVGLIEDDRRLRALREQRIGWLASRGFPTAAIPALELASDWTTIFCLLDDWTEKIDDPMQVQSYLARLLELFRGEGDVHDGDGMAEAFADIGKRLREVSSPTWFATFAARVEDLFKAFSEESQNRAQGHVPAFSRYMYLRQTTIGLRVLFEFCELTDGIKLHDHVRYDPAVQNLVAAACHIVGWANDIYTYKKEIVAGEIHNLIVVAVREHGMTLDEAIAWVADMHDAETRAFEASIDDLPEFGEETSRELGRYTAMLTSWVRGHLDWAHETGRYVTPDGLPPSSKRWEGFVASRRRPSIPPSSRRPNIPPPISSRRPSRLPPASSPSPSASSPGSARSPSTLGPASTPTPAFYAESPSIRPFAPEPDDGLPPPPGSR